MVIDQLVFNFAMPTPSKLCIIKKYIHMRQWFCMSFQYRPWNVYVVADIDFKQQKKSP